MPEPVPEVRSRTPDEWAADIAELLALSDEANAIYEQAERTLERAVVCWLVQHDTTGQEIAKTVGATVTRIYQTVRRATMQPDLEEWIRATKRTTRGPRPGHEGGRLKNQPGDVD